MKAFVLLIFLGFSVNLCQAQTLWVKNKTGVTLDIGGDFKLVADPPCSDPVDLDNFISLAVPPDAGVGFPIPMSRESFRIGGSEPGGGMSGWSKMACIGGEPVECSSSGDFTIYWHDCNSVTIYP